MVQLVSLARVPTIFRSGFLAAILHQTHAIQDKSDFTDKWTLLCVKNIC